MCNCKRYKCSILFEIVGSSANVQLPESERLRKSTVVGIEVVKPGSATLYSPNGVQIAVDAVINSSYLNLVNQNGTKIATVPLAHLVRDFNAPDPFPVNWTDVDPVQSSIRVGTAATGYNAGHVFVVTFWLDCDNCGVPE